MNPKVLLVLVIILGVLFIVGTTSGLLRGGSANLSDSIESVKKIFGDKLAGGQRLKAEDVISFSPPACQNQFTNNQFTLAQGSTCGLTVKESNKGVRSLPLRLTQGANVKVILVPANPDDLNLNKNLIPDSAGKEDRINVQFFKDGGNLAIQCIIGPTCVVVTN